MIAPKPHLLLLNPTHNIRIHIFFRIVPFISILSLLEWKLLFFSPSWYHSFMSLKLFRNDSTVYIITRTCVVTWLSSFHISVVFNEVLLVFCSIFTNIFNFQAVLQCIPNKVLLTVVYFHNVYHLYFSSSNSTSIFSSGADFYFFPRTRTVYWNSSTIENFKKLKNYPNLSLDSSRLFYKVHLVILVYYFVFNLRIRKEKKLIFILIIITLMKVAKTWYNISLNKETLNDRLHFVYVSFSRTCTFQHLFYLSMF